MKLYLASSWRNNIYPGILHTLRRFGHEVYDFRAAQNADVLGRSGAGHHGAGHGLGRRPARRLRTP